MFQSTSIHKVYRSRNSRVADVSIRVQHHPTRFFLFLFIVISTYILMRAAVQHSTITATTHNEAVDYLMKRKDECTRTYRYLVLRIPGTVCSKESTAQHGIAPQGEARHRTALSCLASAAELS